MTKIGKPLEDRGIAEIVAAAAARKAGAAPAAPQPKKEPTMQAAIPTPPKAKIKAKTRAKPPRAKKQAKKVAKKAARARSAPRQRVGARPQAPKPAPAKPSPAPSASPAIRADGLKPGSKQAMLLDLVLQPGPGKTEEELCKALDWKKCRVTLTRVCERVGAKLDKSAKNDAGVTLFKATMPGK